MEKESKKIKIERNEGKTLITIAAQIDKKKFTLLWIWLLLWTLCGMIVFSQFFVGHSKETKLFMFVWFIFWIYFEYKIGYAYLWRKAGKELIAITKTHIYIKRDINGSGKEKAFLKENCRDFKMVDFSSKNFGKHMNKSFWVVGGETLSFNFLGTETAFGMQLTEDEAKEVFKTIKFAVR